MMPSLLDLPRELRDYIIDLVLFTPSQDCSCDDSQRRKVEATDSEPLNGCSFLVKLLPHNGSFVNSTSLLLLNHQLNAETLSTLQRKKASYVLDATVVNERELWPTWKSGPFLSRKADEIYVSIRQVTTTKLGWVRKTNRWLGGDGTPLLAWGFGSLLSLFLIHGPVMDHPEEKDKRISVQKLVLDVQTPDVSHSNLALGPYNPERFPSQNISHLRRLRRESTATNYVMHPDLLLRLLVGYINVLLGYPKEYGRIAYERIGIIQIMLDGQLRNEWDLVDWSMERIESEALKDSIYRERQSMGLPIPSHFVN
jgi:hypothetical protein